MTNGERAKPPQGPQNSEYKIKSDQYAVLSQHFQFVANTKGRGPYGYHEKTEQGRQANAFMNYVASLDLTDTQNRGVIVAGSAAAMGAASSRAERDDYSMYLQQHGGLSNSELTIFSKYYALIFEHGKDIDFNELASYISSQTMWAGNQAFELEMNGQPADGLRLAVLAMTATVTPSIDNQAMMMDQMKDQFVA